MTSTRENSFEQDDKFRPVYYALVWKANEVGPWSGPLELIQVL